MVAPSATRCRAWWKSTRPAFHSGPKTILPPEGKDAATTARCSSSAPSNWGRKHPRPPAAGRNLLLRRRRPRTLRRNRRRSRRHAKTDGWSGYAAVPIATMSMSSGRPPLIVRRGSTKSSPTSKDGREASTYTGCVASICRPISMSSSFASTAAKPASCFPLALPPRHQCRTPYLQHVDRTGAMCISGSGFSLGRWFWLRNPNLSLKGSLARNRQRVGTERCFRRLSLRPPLTP